MAPHLNLDGIFAHLVRATDGPARAWRSFHNRAKFAHAAATDANRGRQSAAEVSSGPQCPQLCSLPLSGNFARLFCSTEVYSCYRIVASRSKRTLTAFSQASSKTQPNKPRALDYAASFRTCNTFQYSPRRSLTLIN